MRIERYFLIFSFLLSPYLSALAEGTKEIMPNVGNPTRLLLDPGSGRVPFALYSSRANPDYRLYIHIENTATERIYFGMGQQRNSNNNAIQTQVNWRIHPPGEPDVDECSGQTPLQNTLPTLPDPGYISTYGEAVAGPNNIDPNGYNPLVCVPTHGAGDYFMTIQATTTRTFDFFDICVVDISTTPPAIIPGRVFSKCWQIRNPSSGGSSWYTFEGFMFIYSNDGIVTKLNPNGMEGRDFAVSCNESGCYPIGGAYNAQQARQSQMGPNPHNYPQYKIFLNNPDQLVYPDGIIGQLVEGSVNTVSSCTNGTIIFNFQTTPVNAVGTVEIILSLSTLTPPLVDRILIENNVPGGSYSVTWDGEDGAGTQVPSGSTFPFTLRYTNGLTHMPLWDVEKNVNGFIVNLVRPVLVPPLDDPAFYWDDVLVGGTQLVDPPGCTVPPSISCHAWTNDWGDQKTINTWWYLVSNSTANVNVTYLKAPSTPVALSPLPPQNSVCPGGTLTFTVANDPLSTSYIWEWFGGNSQTTVLPTLNITFPSNTPAGANFVTVKGHNADCGDGQTTVIPVIILPVPELTTPLAQTTCSGVSLNITLNSNPAATGYTWTVGPGDCTANIAVCPFGNSTGTAITGNLSVTDLNQGSVTYHVTPVAGTCSGETKEIIVTVDPKPNITSPSAPGENLCTGGTTNITLQSGLSGPPLAWAWSALCTNIQNCPAPGNSAIIANQLNLASSASPGSVVYSITPTFGGCAGDPQTYTVNVLQLPVVQLTPFTPVCLNTPAFALTGGTPAGGIYTLGGNPITIFDPAAFGAGVYQITYTYTDGNGCVNSDQKNIMVQSLITPSLTGDASACLNVGEPYVTDPLMNNYSWSVAPDGTISGASPSAKTITWPTTGTKTITLTYTDPNGCTTIPASKTITVNPLPVVSISGNLDVCNSRAYTYTTQPGMTGYTWNVSPGNNLSSAGNTATVTWIVVGTEWIEVNYFDANGCTAVTPKRENVVVNPSPVYTVTGSTSVCAGSATTYKLQGTEVGNWSLSSGGTLTPPVSNANLVSVSWNPSNSAGTASVFVSYVTALGCPGTTTTTISIQPQPVVSFTTTTPSPVCQDFPTPSPYIVSPGGPAASYLWSVTPSANATITNPTANPAQITWRLTGATSQTAQLTLSATTTDTNPACSLTSAPMFITINPKPNTQLSYCFDQLTTTSGKPFKLRGGTPMGGSGQYFIDQTTGTPVTWFNPATAGLGAHTIYYGYTNVNGCIAFDSKQITVAAPASFGCGGLMTDPRDNKTYRTIQIGTQCWMQENLRYAGSTLSLTTPSADNCIFERYCLTTDPNCTLYGGFYQWDELMQYNDDLATTRQGFCPPGWHVPTESEWITLVNTVTGTSNGSGIAGSYLKDLTPSGQFRAGLAGIIYLNNLEAFTGTPVTGTFYWTSSPVTTERSVARGLNSINPSVSRYEGANANAFPVRCIRD